VELSDPSVAEYAMLTLNGRRIHDMVSSQPPLSSGLLTQAQKSSPPVSSFLSDPPLTMCLLQGNQN
jgi:hypothetical protein